MAWLNSEFRWPFAIMSNKTVSFDGVRFWNLASESFVSLPGDYQVPDPSMIPMRGEFVKFEGVEGEFIVMQRHFEFRLSTCSVLVHIQPATRDADVSERGSLAQG